MPRTRVLLLTLLAATVALVGARVTQAADPLKECRLSCKQAKGACIGQVKHHLQALLGECVGGSSERRQCRRQARGTARAERTACGDFVRECHTCCAARGSDCAVRCGDGVVTPARGEQCDPPGSACENGAICDAECHCVTRPGACTGACPIHTVFLILMENHDWSSIKNSPSAPYINNTLLAIASHATQYYNPPGLHRAYPTTSGSKPVRTLGFLTTRSQARITRAARPISSRCSTRRACPGAPTRKGRAASSAR